MSTKPAITFSHIGLHCFDLEAMVGFYTGVMGLTETDRGEIPFQDTTVEIVFLSGEPRDHHQIALVGRPARTVPASDLLLNQISFRLDGLPTLRRVKRLAEEAGVEGFIPISHGNAWSIYFPDPEGNTIEAFVDSPWYVAQPRADALDLSLSDEEIVDWTRQSIEDESTFQPVEQWRTEIGRKMGVGV